MENSINDQLLNHLIQHIDKKLDADKSSEFKKFSKLYYDAVPFNDLEVIAIEDLYGAVLSHWNLGLKLEPGEHKINVFNPSLDIHGWQSGHTIVEIITQDKPFLLQSVGMEINRHGLTNHLVIHPVLHIKRDASGKLIGLAEADDEDYSLECLLHLEIDRLADRSQLDHLKQRLQCVLRDVEVTTADWSLCLQQMQQVIDDLANSGDDNYEQKEFLQWLYDNHFIFLGYREYQLVRQNQQYGFKPIVGSGLGILRDDIADAEASGVHWMSEDVFNHVQNQRLLIITKATSKSTVHRPVFMDYIGIKQFNEQGELVGEKRFLGLYSSTAYLTELKNIPMIRQKIKHIQDQFSFRKGSHQARSLFFILQSLPRNEILMAGMEDLLKCSTGVMHLHERQRVRVFARHDLYGHFVSLLVYVPRERYTTSTRIKIQKILLEVFKAQRADFTVQLTESILARIHFIIHTDVNCCVDFDVHEIEQKIVEVLTEWRDELKTALLTYHGESAANQLYSDYASGFNAAYRESVSSRTAILDIDCFEQLLAKQSHIITLLYSPQSVSIEKDLRFKIFCTGQASLSKSLPMLENMGITVRDERPYPIHKKYFPEALWMHDFGLSLDSSIPALDLENLKPRFQQAFEQCWTGKIENDGFNQLILKADIEWRQVNIFRAFYFYLRQLGIAFSQNYVETTLANNPEVVHLLIAYFHQRFDPDYSDDDQDYMTTIEQAIERVTSLDEDRILRRFLNLIQAAVRTNYFKQSEDKDGIPYIAVKFKSSLLIDIPSPVPYFEIFVYSPRIEGIHLRGGAVARGGLRWSDRREDFRTEVLGLMKAQMTKNAVIVPTGSKGGFVVKKLKQFKDPEKINQEVISCYQIFISGLLELTDNLNKNQLAKPEKVKCCDDDDTYLVVAADKGTARFSDYANALSEQYQFWLGDAFASGGSEGYDHKKMGITARGAWESVKHHFMQLAIPYQQKPFTMTGIGGMGGDVFGNGLLLSGNIKLIAAFDHAHIFLDPNPDPEISFQERSRLFHLPGAAWSDYQTNHISQGGGVYSRQLKSITLSPTIRQRLNIKQETLTPNKLIKSILKAPVDLLWNGGIGTYVKSTQEQHLEVGDKANDNVRINGVDLRCRVVAEGGNLGFTQAGRIEFAQHGGNINTDSIDNSAGVDCSDHEVNIKILLNSIVAEGDLTVKQRNQLLQAMTDEVAELVLKNNQLQNAAISIIEHYAKQDMPGIMTVISVLEQAGNLNKALEKIPENETLLQRVAEDKGLYRPEISVLLAYCKQMLKQQLQEKIEELDKAILNAELIHYFPQTLQQQFTQPILNHSLAQQIASNQLINTLVNRMGIVFPIVLLEESGQNIAAIVTVFKRVCKILGIEQLWQEIEAIEGTIKAGTIDELYLLIRKSVERAMYRFLSSTELIDTDTEINFYIEGIEKLSKEMDDFISAQNRQQSAENIERLKKQQVPESLAKNIIILDTLYLCLDVIGLNQQTQQPLEDCAQIFFELFDTFDLLWLRDQINQLPTTTVWESLAKSTSREEFKRVSCQLTLTVLSNQGQTPQSKMAECFNLRNEQINRYKKLLAMVKSDSAIELEKVTVLLKELDKIAE